MDEEVGNNQKLQPDPQDGEGVKDSGGQDDKDVKAE